MPVPSTALDLRVAFASGDAPPGVLLAVSRSHARARAAGARLHQLAPPHTGCVHRASLCTKRCAACRGSSHNHPHSSHPLPLRPPVLKDSASRQRAGRRRTRSPTTPGGPTRSSGFISPSSVRATSPPSVLSRATRTRSHCAWRCSLRSGSRWRSACRSASTATPPTPPSSVRAPRSSRAGSWGASPFKVG